MFTKEAGLVPFDIAQACPERSEGMKCGVGDDNWPDGKYRNIAFTPVLRPTNKENTYIIEMSCWLRTK